MLVGLQETTAVEQQMNTFWQRRAQTEWSVQCAFVLLYYISEEGEAEEVIRHVSCIEHQSPVGTALLSSRQGDLAVFYHLITPVHLADHTHRLCRIGFLHHLETKQHNKTL